MGFFSRHRKAFRSVIASFGILFGLLVGCASNPVVEQEKEPENAQVMPFSSGPLNLGIEGLSASYSGDGSFSYSGGTLSGKVHSNLAWNTSTATLTITNISSSILSVSVRVDDVNVSKGAVKGDGSASIWGKRWQTDFFGVPYVINGFLAPRGMFEIIIMTQGTDRNTTISISNIAAEKVAKYATIFKPSSPLNAGTFTVDGTQITTETTKEKTPLESYNLKFVPASGQTFVGWDVNGELLSNSTEYSFSPTENNQVVFPRIYAAGTAMFSVGGMLFDDLGQAIIKASDGADKIVRLHKSGSVSPKADGSSYVFSNEVNLFIPGSDTSNYFDFAKKEPPIQESNQTRTCSYTLTLSSGVRINVSKGSSICIAGQMWYASGGNLTSLPIGPVGELCLADGSVVTLGAGACFYAWGYASGSGQIHALSGSQVYEGFCFSYRGGSASTSMKPVFVFNQYYVQNIEAHLYVYAGATEKTIAAVQALKGAVKKSTDVTFIGADGMFALDSGYVVKYYNPVTDRLSLDVYGDGRLSRIKVSLGGAIFDVDSAEYLLPICNNMDISVSSGTVSVEQDLDFLPGSSLTVKTGAVATLGTGRKVFFYDLSNWNGKGYGFNNVDMRRIDYVSPSAMAAFSKANRKITTGAYLKLNGEFKNKGGVYMTKPNNNTQKTSELGRIISDGGGKFTYLAQEYQYGQDVSEKTSQYNQASGKVDSISATTAVFINSDDSVFSKTCPKGAALVFENGVWKMQYQGPYNIDITFKNVDGSTLKTQSFNVDPSGSGIVLPDQTEFTAVQGTIFLWLKETDKTVSYEPKKNVDIIEPIVLIAFTGGWYTDFNKDTFYYDRSTGKTKGLKYIYEEGTWPEALYCFNENGHLLLGKNQLFSYEQGAKYDGGGDGNVYYVDNGVVQNNVGLTEYDALVGEIAARYYYYFGPSHYAYRNTTCYINTNLNNVLPEGVYTFGNDGRVEALECSNFTDVDSVTLSADGYCTFRTIKAGIGLFVSGTHIYYAKDDGSIMKNGTYYVEKGKLNGKATEAGLYYFDTNGYLCDSMMNPITVTLPEANA